MRRVPGWKPFSSLLWGTSTSVMLRMLNIILYVVWYIYIYACIHIYTRNHDKLGIFPWSGPPPQPSPISHPNPLPPPSRQAVNLQRRGGLASPPVGSWKLPWKLNGACPPENQGLVSDVYIPYWNFVPFLRGIFVMFVFQVGINLKKWSKTGSLEKPLVGNQAFFFSVF